MQVLNEEEIKRLINNGFDLELLSFELDIPIEKLERLKLQQDEINSKNSSKNSYNIEKTNIQIPKRKNSNIKRKQQEDITELPVKETKTEITKTNYEELINEYKNEINSNPEKAQGIRNLLAFAYFKSGKINEAKNELISLIEETNNYTAYRQLVYIEKVEGDFEEAKLWAYEALDYFPNSIKIREQLVSIARIEKDEQEIIKQLKDISNVKVKNDREIGDE